MAGSIVQSTKEYLDEMTAVFGKVDTDLVDRYADVLLSAWRDRKRVFVFGNGGSAFTASHHALDYVKTAAVPNQRRLQAISIVDNIGLTTAVGNDLHYADTFAYPLESFAAAGDVAVAISCSGNSPNVVQACRWSKTNGLFVVAITGFDGGALASIADLHINIPSDNYGIIEDIQMSVGHVAAQMLFQRVTQETTLT